MRSIFRLAAAVARDPAVDAWFDRQPAELGAIARTWFERMRRCGTDVRELVHDGCPVACVGDAAFAYVNAFRTHVDVGFFHGAALPDPARLLEGSGKFMRHVKLRPGIAVDDISLQALIDVACQDIRARLAAQA